MVRKQVIIFQLIYSKSLGHLGGWMDSMTWEKVYCISKIGAFQT